MIRILAALLGGLSAVAVAQPAGQVPSGTTLFQLDLSRTPVGEIPASIDVVNGILEVVLKNGMPMLKASALSEFRITLQPPGQVLPPDFTLEFDLIPKQGSNPQDLSVEGTANINQGDASAHVLWHATGSLSVIGGGGDTYETPMPEDFQASLPGVLTKVILEVEGPTLKLYTNGRRLYTLRKQFARGGVLRVYLGAQNGGTEAVYLAGMRVTAGTGSGILAGGGQPNQQGGQQGQPRGQGQLGQQGQQGGQPQQLLNPNPLPVVRNTTQQQQSPQNSQPQPQTATNQFGITGTMFPVTVTMGASGPTVSWPDVPNATGYIVGRSKSDDLNCCNASSGRAWDATSPWQDGVLPMPGTYIYTVMANTPQGQVQGQASFDFGLSGMPQLSPPIAANAGVPSAGSFTVTVTLGSAGPLVTWPAVPNATSYAVNRWKADDPGCCNVVSGTGRGWGATSPWQDQPLPLSGTYVYSVSALTAAGVLSAQAQFDFQLSGGSATSTVITTIASPTGTITLVPPPAPPPSSGTGLTPNRPSGYTVNATQNTGTAPQITVTGTPNTAQVVWSFAPVGGLATWPTNVTYRVRRAVAGTGVFTGLTPTPLSVNLLNDVLPDFRKTYTYEVTAFHPDGTSGTASANFTPPPPTDPTGFTATVKAIDEVDLVWSGVGAPAEYFITGPGTGSGVTVPGVQDPSHQLHHSIKGLPAGTHTWHIATSYLPGGILTAQAQWPAATAMLAVAGKYEISFESVQLQAHAQDDVFHMDGLFNEFYVTAFVRTMDNRGNIVRETSHKSPTYGDITYWPPPNRIRAGSAGVNGGVWNRDLITPIWEQPAAGALGYSRMVLWSGTLTAGVDMVDVAPVIWESDNNPEDSDKYEMFLRQGYYLLDLNTRTQQGDISNVMLPDERKHTSGVRGEVLVTLVDLGVARDRPIGIAAPDQSPTTNHASWYKIAIRFDHAVAEAALSGKYGPPGLIPLRLVDHLVESKSTYSHPDIGMGDYTLNIRVKRLP